AVALVDLVFTRDWFEVIAVAQLPATDRVGAILAAIRGQTAETSSCGRVEIRLPENTSDPDLGNFARKFMAPLSKALRGAGLLAGEKRDTGTDHLEILLVDFQTAIIGISAVGNRSPFAGGIPRLRLLAAAPSRSAMKLDEAWKVFLPQSRLLEYLGGGCKAVDLGAAPGGWTWQLVRHGMLVTAVDNGPMQPELMASGHVEHVRADGYLWRPRRAVDWMVCDIVDKPRRTATLVADWFVEGLCRYSIFNLKLPMKTRYEEWLACRSLILERLDRAGIPAMLRARQLYHDREEITCFLERLGD
ncbi:MAG: 23S rRNA (cytidine(2498)-2'-O)-methyltransferase RlmM, partial [Pseudohongiellaceae bacterium]